MKNAIVLFIAFMLPNVWANAESFAGGKKPAQEPVVPSYTDVKYGEHEKELINFWQSESEQPLGVLLDIHGGGWMGGAKKETMEVSQLHPGYHFASISYPLVNEGALQPAMLNSALRAVQFLRYKAKEWNIDPQRIVVTGGSAGGCSSLLVALHDDVANPQSNDPVERFSSRVAGASVAGAQTTLNPFVIKERIGEETFGNPMTYKPFGAETAEELMENWEAYKVMVLECSPITHLSADDPPLYLFYNVNREIPTTKSSNGIHSPVFGEIMLEACKEQGVECHLEYWEKDRPKPTINRQQFLDRLLLKTDTTFAHAPGSGTDINTYSQKQIVSNFNGQNASAVTHQAVEGEALSEEYSVTVNGKNVPVYTARVDELYRKSPLQMDDTYSFASFECSGPVEVVVRSNKPLSAFSIRPNGENVAVNLEEQEATFVLERNGNFLIERNGNGRKDPLLLFANPLEVNPPQPGDPDVIYFGPGRHNSGLIELSSNQTLYIDGGAIVTGRVIAKGDNIRIIGRGLLENSGQEYYGKYMILLDSCRNVKVEGIVLRKNNRGWTLVSKNCDEVIVSNVKICGSFYGNDDGIDPVNTRNMIIEDCLIRTKDDCLAFKGMDNELSNCENITVNHTTMWSDQCCTILLGDESRARFMRNITIKNCFVPYLSYEGYPKKFLMLHSGEDMRMENLLFENIEIGGEGQERNYIEISCEFNQYSKTKTAGHIRNVLLKNVHLTGKEGPYNIVIKGYDKSHGIEDLTFENCTINGKPLTPAYPNLQIGEFTKDIRFTSQQQEF